MLVYLFSLLVILLVPLSSENTLYHWCLHKIKWLQTYSSQSLMPTYNNLKVFLFLQVWSYSYMECDNLHHPNFFITSNLHACKVIHTNFKTFGCKASNTKLTALTNCELYVVFWYCKAKYNKISKISFGKFNSQNKRFMSKLRSSMFAVSNNEQRIWSEQVKILCPRLVTTNKTRQCHSVRRNKKLKQSNNKLKETMS